MPIGKTSKSTVLVDPVDKTRKLNITSDGRADITQHSHIDTGAIHFHVDGLGTGTHRFILIDASDTVSYSHIFSTYMHLEWLRIQSDATSNGAYSVAIGFLEDVDETNGDRYIVAHWDRNLQTGNSIDNYYNFLPAGWRMTKGFLGTHAILANSPNYRTNLNLLSTLSPVNAGLTPSGNGDVVCEVTVISGSMSISIDIGYHSH